MTKREAKKRACRALGIIASETAKSTEIWQAMEEESIMDRDKLVEALNQLADELLNRAER